MISADKNSIDSPMWCNGDDGCHGEKGVIEDEKGTGVGIQYEIAEDRKMRYRKKSKQRWLKGGILGQRKRKIRERETKREW
jgi:hypothetical protein